MNITLKEAVENFRKQWNWMAAETLRRKRKVEKGEYFDAQDINEQDRPKAECYLCGFVELHSCDKCPVKWTGIIDYCYNKNTRYGNKGLFAQWEDANDYIKAAHLAREIANLPLKEKY